MLHVCRVEVDAKTEFAEPLSIRRRSLWTRLVRKFARVICGQTVLLFIIIVSVSGCWSDYLKPSASSVVRVTAVSIGLEAAYPLADMWMARDAEFGAVTVQGGGSDSVIWVEKAVPPAVVQAYADWIISCAKKVDLIYSVVVESDDTIVASWDNR